ncbi:MAG: hypothetical protein JW808_07295 [Victivallales bacterium]|nr:hypothetical protein [Victivallales bacterium]
MKFPDAIISRVSRFLPLIIVAAAILPFIPGLEGELLFDDIPLIREDPFYIEQVNPLQCWNRSFWKIERTQGLYRPLTLFSYWLDIKAYSPLADPDTGLFEPGFRITNLLLHTIVCLLVFKLVSRLRFGKSVAFLSAMLFALHPIHVEAVTPAFGRGELLCSLFFMAGLILHSYRKESSICIPAATLCYMLSFMSKENGVAFLPVCMMMDLCLAHKIEFKPRPVMQRLAPFAIYLVAPAAVFALRFRALGTLLPAKDHFMPAIDNVIALSPPLLRVVAAIRIQGIALAKFFWPATLSHDYSFAEILPSESFFDFFAWLTVLSFALAVATLIMIHRRDCRKILFLTSSYIILIIPAGNFIVPAGTIFAERLQYLPSLCLCIASANFLSRISRKIHAVPFVALVLLILMTLFVRTFHRTYAWKSELALSLAGVETAPRSVKIWNNLSVQLSKIGDYGGAVIAADKTTEIYPEYATGYANKGTYLAQLGHLQEAKESLRHALRLSINHLHANYMLGVVYAEEGYHEKALLVWERILEVYPRDPKLIEAVNLARQGKWRTKTRVAPPGGVE